MESSYILVESSHLIQCCSMLYVIVDGFQGRTDCIVVVLKSLSYVIMMFFKCGSNVLSSSHQQMMLLESLSHFVMVTHQTLTHVRVLVLQEQVLFLKTCLHVVACGLHVECDPLYSEHGSKSALVQHCQPPSLHHK